MRTHLVERLCNGSWWDHLQLLGRTAVRLLVVGALLLTGVWRALAEALDGLLDGLAGGWVSGADLFGAEAPRAVAVATGPLARLSRIFGRAATGLQRLAAAHRQLAERVDTGLLSRMPA